MATNTALRRDGQKLTAFLDSNVVVSYVRGEGAAAHIFDPEVRSRVLYAVNPVVLQEAILAGDERMRPALMELIDNKTINILDIDPNKAEGVLQRTRELHNRIAHSNDLLIFSNASACDYLVTDDTSLTAFAPDDAPIVLNAEQFLARVLSQP